MTIRLPRLLKRYVDEKVSSGAYRSAGEFVREAIREKYERDREEARRALAAKLLKGLEGEPIPFTKAYFRRKRAQLVRRVRHGADGRLRP
jgi:putative addiction module CopG family antidote